MLHKICRVKLCNIHKGRGMGSIPKGRGLADVIREAFYACTLKGGGGAYR